MMKKSIFFFSIQFYIILVMLTIFNSSLAQETQKVYVGTFTSEGAEGIYLCDFYPESGKIKLNKTFKAINDPSFFKISYNKKYMYVASRAPKNIEKSGGYVIAYKIQPNGNLAFLNKQISHGSDPCHIDVSADGKFAAVANYNGGTVAFYPLDEKGKIMPATTVIQNTGQSIDENRQTKPHAHSVKFSPFSNEVFSADLGTDQFNIFNIKENTLGKNQQEYVKLNPGAGPRHFDFHPLGDHIYIINELNSTISAVQKKENKWQIFQSISTLPSGFEGKSFCADIHVSNSGRFLYGSNRGDNSIAVFAITSTNKQLLKIGNVSTEGNWPRNFTISPDGNFMLVANQRSGNITVFEINQENGLPVFTGNEIKLPSPVCLEFL